MSDTQDDGGKTCTVLGMTEKPCALLRATEKTHASHRDNGEDHVVAQGDEDDADGAAGKAFLQVKDPSTPRCALRSG
ncbi:hypothetical protein [Bifidobacterium moraviense]|uniref:hypothetical protein n=1 Tax=Bifidobacterium moraviense TaxID=2675323 RepID=UPI00145F9A7C|nr:hypothetical protein [Bifidobacterium sp. DSM 109958]